MRPEEIRQAHRHCADRARPCSTDPGQQTMTTSGSPKTTTCAAELGIDGLRIEDERARLDPEDHASSCVRNQLLRGPLRLTKKHGLLSHLFVDEAQDLSPLELAVLIAQTTPDRSITLAGDTSQRLFLENGFATGARALPALALPRRDRAPAHRVPVDPRILEVARYAWGRSPIPNRRSRRVRRPVEAHHSPGNGAAVAFLADALRPLFAREPRATVALLARHPEQADLYYEGLKRAEVPHLRRVRAQDFAFRPGVEVTDMRR